MDEDLKIVLTSELEADEEASAQRISAQLPNISDYDQLKNRPVTNIAGTGTVISALETGVYNIEGTWKLTPDDIERETLADDLFYVMNNGAESKLTWISAGQIKTYGVPVGGTAADITEGSIATTEEVVRNMVGVF